jgi:hypothetical protein
MAKTKFVVSLVKPDGASKDMIRRHIQRVIESSSNVGPGAITDVSVSIVPDPVKVPTPFKRGKVTRDPFRATRG